LAFVKEKIKKISYQPSPFPGILTEIAPPYYVSYDTVTQKKHGKNRTRGRELNEGDLSPVERIAPREN
jgi:hypothetical protein